MKPRQMTKVVSNLVYPRRCPFCDRVLGQRTECKACAPLVDKLEVHPFRLPPGEHCLLDLDGAASVYLYQDQVQQAILRMKYSGRASYGEAMGCTMANRLFGCTFEARSGIIIPCSAPPMGLEYDLIVPVPASGGYRGFNPPQRIAAPLAEAMHLPLVPGALKKVRTTLRQEGLSRQQRLTNLIGAFEAVPRLLPPNARVLLVDDVITTGATVSACAGALVKAGAQSVFAVSFAVREQEERED